MSKIRNIVLTIVSIRAVKSKRDGTNIPLTKLMEDVSEGVRISRGDFSQLFEGFTDADVGGQSLSAIQTELEADYRRSHNKLVKAQVKRWNRSQRRF